MKNIAANFWNNLFIENLFCFQSGQEVLGVDEQRVERGGPEQRGVEDPAREDPVRTDHDRVQIRRRSRTGE